MELEFDKEIDAILRKAPVGRGVLVGDDPPEPKKHLDADTIAAFAENAVPPKAKLLYMEHFADCDRCRRMLSQSILMKREADAATNGVASTVVSAPVATTIPWYSKLFRTPNLALAMGALILTFGGILGFLAFQNYKNQAGVSTAQVTDLERARDEKSYGGTAAGNMVAANASANAAANSANTAVPAPVNPSAAGSANSSGPAVSEPDAFGRADTAPGTVVQPEKEKTAATGGAMPEAAKPVAAAPPPPPVDQPASLDARKAGEDKLKDDDSKTLTMSKAENDRDRMAREAPMAKKSGPNRASGQMNNVQQEMNVQQNQSVAGMIAPTKSVGGKTFTNRDGAWYDTAYHGQSTKNYRRGTDEYKKLDGGLRSIADSISGTVVLVWKSKAYRVQ